jgi:hypothetical protein
MGTNTIDYLFFLELGLVCLENPSLYREQGKGVCFMGLFGQRRLVELWHTLRLVINCSLRNRSGMCEAVEFGRILFKSLDFPPGSCLCRTCAELEVWDVV